MSVPSMDQVMESGCQSTVYVCSFCTVFEVDDLPPLLSAIFY